MLTEKAAMHDLGHGLTLSIGRDGVWLNFKAEGSQCAIHVHNTLGTGGDKRSIIAQSIDSWCAEREAAAKQSLTASAPALIAAMKERM